MREFRESVHKKKKVVQRDWEDSELDSKRHPDFELNAQAARWFVDTWSEKMKDKVSLYCSDNLLWFKWYIMVGTQVYDQSNMVSFNQAHDYFKAECTQMFRALRNLSKNASLIKHE